jgi:hypothetical protein
VLCVCGGVWCVLREGEREGVEEKKESVMVMKVSKLRVV